MTSTKEAALQAAIALLQREDVPKCEHTLSCLTCFSQRGEAFAGHKCVVSQSCVEKLFSLLPPENQRVYSDNEIVGIIIYLINFVVFSGHTITALNFVGKKEESTIWIERLIFFFILAPAKLNPYTEIFDSFTITNVLNANFSFVTLANWLNKCENMIFSISIQAPGINLFGYDVLQFGQSIPCLSISEATYIHVNNPMAINMDKVLPLLSITKDLQLPASAFENISINALKTGVLASGLLSVKKDSLPLSPCIEEVLKSKREKPLGKDWRYQRLCPDAIFFSNHDKLAKIMRTFLLCMNGSKKSVLTLETVAYIFSFLPRQICFE